MICKYCNTQLPDTAKFCMECGQPQKTPESVKQTRWETCEIVCIPNPKGNREWEFRAEGNGANGKYLVCQPYVTTVNPLAGADVLTEDRSKYVRFVLSSLVRALIQEGWEPLELLGAHWYSYRFRRKITS